MSTRIGIIGAEAIGGIVGGMLTKAGHDVTLIDQWPDHVEAMKKVGLRLSGTCGEHLIPVRALNIHELQSVAEPFDAIFIAVKSYDTEWVVSLALQYLRKPDGFLVDFQNGINDERVAALAGRERSLGCVITIGAGAARLRPATAAPSNRWRPRPSASAAKCCGKASNRCRSTQQGWPRPPGSTPPGGRRPFRSPALLPWPVN